jgi:hypothetical protein
LKRPIKIRTLLEESDIMVQQLKTTSNIRDEINSKSLATAQEMNPSVSSGLEQTNAMVGSSANITTNYINVMAYCSLLVSSDESLQVQSESFPPITVNPVACNSDKKAGRLKIRDLARKECPDGILESYRTSPPLTQFDYEKMKDLQ